MMSPPEAFPDSEYRVVILVQDDGLPPRQATAHVLVNLPALTPTGVPPITATITTTEAPTNAAVKEEPNDVVPIILGVVAAVLLFVVIVLAILLVRSKMAQGSADIQTENASESRHAFKDENLEKVKPPSHLDPEGLAYRSTKPSNGMFPSTLDLNFDADHGETEDGATTVQHNPITSINHGYSGSDMSEMGRDMGDIRIQTSMTPYKDGYIDYTENDLYGTGDMKTFHHTGSSCESLSSDSTPGSKKQLVKPDLVEHDKGNGKPFSWNNLNSTEEVSGNDTKPAEEKPEITVYF
ncbi:uncharacterized protein LOC135479231 [Liolophura sinensis]|uniref:uncharacterized protein LOC135479231 n=1 Tax=Liolophura sinensis TaxID=3198878 RepID=UPI0031590B6D